MRRTSAITELARMLVAGGITTDRLERAPTVDDMRTIARRRLPRMSFDFVDGGAGAETTLRANVSDLARVTLRPRSLVDVSEPSLSTLVVGQRLPMPVVLAPCGLIRVIGGDGELSAVRAAGAAGLTYTISTASSWSIEEIAAEASGPLWFQLYMWRSREVIAALVQRAKEAGCTALVLTVDVVVNSKRPRDHRNGMSIPPQITLRNVAGAVRHPAWFASLLHGPAIGFRNLQGIAEGSSAMSHQEYVNSQLANLSPSWDDIAWLRRCWDGPLFIKGITTVEDAESAAAAGADGIFVSNHGGRQLDGLPSAISTLPLIADAVGDRLDIILDSGIRSGGDVVKAVALGAKATAIGRSWVWGAAAAGQRGVEHVAKIYRTEIEEALMLLGCPDVANLDRSRVNYPLEWDRLGPSSSQPGGPAGPASPSALDI
ncbi:MAG TPA: alpha-hydroxy acid oxidase [Propionibacteriaceae bacterium]|nr:alpha-hydroxy acid oxidase [Propionibacteriaceae bacterium]